MNSKRREGKEGRREGKEGRKEGIKGRDGRKGEIEGKWVL
jgi:hypothetical protein